MELDPDLAEYPQPVRLPAEMKRDYFSFGFVRCPFERLESLWRQKVIHTPLHGQKIWGLTKNELMSFRDFDRFLTWLEHQDLKNGEAHYRAQSRLLPLDLDFLGKLESFAQDWAALMAELGTSESIDVRHKNSTPASKKALTRGQKDRILSLYQSDFQRFYPELL